MVADVLLDNVHHIETPEGSLLRFHPAGIVVRIYAYAIDLLLKTIVLAVGFAALGAMGGLGWGFGLIIWFLMQWFYPVYFEVWRDGQTLGKKRAGLRVIHHDGTPVAFSTSLIRNLLRAVDFLPFFYVAGIVSMIFNRDFKRLGDLAAGTLVVYSHRPPQATTPNEQGLCPLPADFNTDEQRAVLAFAERTDLLSPERQAELAAVLEPVLPPGDPVRTLRQMANSIVGQV